METSRRALLGTAVALIAAPGVQAKEKPKSDWQVRQERRRSFIEEMATIHPNGRLVASKAMSLDMVEPDDLKGMVTRLRNDDGRLPILYFNVRGDVPREIVVNAHVAYIHGPVI